MKVKKQTFVLLLTVLIGIPTISAQSKQERDKTMEKVVRKIITSKDYKLKVDTYMVAQESPTPVNFCSTIEIKNDSIFPISFIPVRITYLIAIEEENFTFRPPLKNMHWI